MVYVSDVITDKNTVNIPDHVFREYDIRGVVGEELTDEFAYLLGRALGKLYKDENIKTAAVGRDARASSGRFSERIICGLTESGVDVFDIGLVPTPVLYYSLFNLDIDGGVMITGSHNPPNENGFKICLGKSTIYGRAIRNIREIMIHRDFVSGRKGNCAQISLNREYIDEICKSLSTCQGVRRIKAVVDAGNGTGNIIAPSLYRCMGHDITELYSKPDPEFPNHHPDPTVPENLEDLIAKVSEIGAEVGIAFDGDGDRMGVVTGSGDILWGDQLLIFFARDVLARRPGAKIIGEVKCSEALFEEIERLGGKSIMWRVGHSLIKAKLKEEKAVLAGEMSGHLFFADMYYGYDDAIYAGARLLELLSRSEITLQELANTLPKTYNTPEIRIECPEELKKIVVEYVADAFSEDLHVSRIDGARIKFPHGWGLVRASNTQPALVLRFEATRPGHLDKISAGVRAKVSEALCRCVSNQGYPK
ncbi:MAG: phosphomannomutase/phosphoglucomutase [Firmicutes bacterium]|jgi:phosphomannomutase/phosphoglucomutase|nr:phosphomannomutase/phosphoglucomutase [Bacillota bacterium]